MTQALAAFGGPAVLFWRSLRAARRHGIAWREVLVQLVELGSRSALLVGAGMAFFGGVMVTMAYAQARKYTGNITVVGPAYFQLLVREFGPMIAALLAATRAGAGTSAELAAMAVNEQVEALELSAADPHAELVVPRFLAGLVAVPALTVIGTVAATLSASLMVTYAFGADGRAFIDARLVGGGDLWCAAVKAVLCGAFIPLAAASRGLKASGGAAAVGEAVTRGVVDACMGCLLIDFAVSAAFLVLGW